MQKEFTRRRGGGKEDFAAKERKGTHRQTRSFLTGLTGSKKRNQKGRKDFTRRRGERGEEKRQNYPNDLTALEKGTNKILPRMTSFIT